MAFIYDKNALCDLAKKFYTLTGIKAVIFDTAFNGIVEYPKAECPFCAKMRQNKEFLQRCDHCLKEAGLACRNNNELNIYKCHAGIFEVISPIKINGVFLGYFTIGQIFGSKDDDHQILKYASQFTNDEVGHLLYNKEGKTLEQIEAAAKIMQACIAYILMSNIIKSDNGDIILRLNDYIEKNIANDLSVECICNEFGVSRNALYKLSSEFFGMPIATYIRNKKIDTAAHILKQGKTVAEAADMVGFYDYNYFSKVFKAVKGLPPREYKKNSYYSI